MRHSLGKMVIKYGVIDTKMLGRRKGFNLQTH